MPVSLFANGEPQAQRLDDAWLHKIIFSGEGRARFRLQHTADRHGQPDDLLWADVTSVCDARQRPRDSLNSGDHTIAGVLVDWVEGEATVFYRRFRAKWLRVVPHDEGDNEALALCRAYTVNLETT